MKLRFETGLQFLNTSLSIDNFFEDWSNMGLLEILGHLPCSSEALIIELMG